MLDRVAGGGPAFRKKLYFPFLPSIRVSPMAAHPDVLLAVRIDGSDGRSRQALRIPELMAVARERQRLPLKPVQSGRRRANPNTSLSVLEHRRQRILADAVRILRRVPICDGVSPRGIDLEQAVSPRRQPQVPVGVFVDSQRPADLRRWRLAILVRIQRERRVPRSYEASPFPDV